jgi:S-formylglutathione hydrolase FrmB
MVPSLPASSASAAWTPETCGGSHSRVAGSGTIRPHIQLLIDDNTRLWVFSPATLTSIDEAAMIGYADQAQGSNTAFYAHYRSADGTNGHFDIPLSGDHGWSIWGPQLCGMSGDVIATIK